MRVLDRFPHEVRHIENIWIPMPDGVRLAARVWMPEDAERNPVPAILEYIPYRKRDLTRSRDSLNHPYYAGHGYACLRVDLRGSGESDGVLRDEYLEQELQDGVEVIEWIARQPWCNGSVGMIGISWGGFNALQIAAMRPPALQAIITVCSTDDRYADDVHYMGGCLLGDNLSWASTMFARNSLPPDPELVGPRWRQMWMERLQGSGLWLEKWLCHQHRDEYWKHGSVCEDISDIRCPVMAVSGWADGYSNAVFRLLAELRVPRQGLIGPWSHRYPHMGKPGPAIGFLQESLRWWDRWLKGEDTGIEKEPMLRAWMQDSVPPSTSYTMRPGRWVSERSWPSAKIDDRVYRMNPARLVSETEPPVVQEVTVQSPLRLGLFAGKWCSYSAPPDLPSDQREEDGGALIFDSDALEERLEVFGAPEVELEIASEKPVAMIAVRLSDISTDHKATRVTYGVLNLTHRESHENPQPLEPGETYHVRLQLNEVAHAFPAGHRLRIAVSTSYWPLAWPAPELSLLTLYTGASHLHLPVREPRSEDDELRPFDEPQSAPSQRRTWLTPSDHHWRVIRDLASDESTLEVVKDEGVYRIEAHGLEVHTSAVERYTVRNDDPGSLRGETEWVVSLARGDWSIETHTYTKLTSTRTHFIVHATLDAYEGERRVYSRNWDVEIPRDLV